jgi:hypothetical protein
MARPTTFPFKDFIVQLGDGGAPETFAKPCGLTSQGISFTKETNETTVPDCDDPDLAAATERAVVSTSATFSGEGILAAEALPDWWAFYELNGSRNVKFELVGGGTWTGKMILSTFNPTAALGEKVSVSVEMVSDGPVTFVPTPLQASANTPTRRAA